MPRYNRGRPWQNSEDNRSSSDPVKRRVFFKANHTGYRGRKSDYISSIQAHVEDEDIGMKVPPIGKGRFINKQRRNSPAPRGFSDKVKLIDHPTSWYKILLPHGNRYDKTFVIKQLQNLVQPMLLVPVAWKTSGTQAFFFVDDFKIAKNLQNADKQVVCPDGFKLIVRVFQGVPPVEINASFKESMKLAMAKRYSAMTGALDLTKFHTDPGVIDLFCALSKSSIMTAALEVISDNIPQLNALNLNDNKLTNLENLSKLEKNFPNLKILYLGQNKLRDIKHLDPLKGLALSELLLDGNPLCDKFKDKATYISEVRKRFPKVIKLDGVDLPPPIGFDLDEKQPLPPVQQTFLCAAEGQDIIRQFLEQYFAIFDSDTRQPLLQAYHENAMFSMTCEYPQGVKNKNNGWLNRYFSDSRNLRRILDVHQRHKLLQQGQMQIVKLLSKMPNTQHDIHSFTVDLALFTPQILMLNVTGVFKELESGQKFDPIRAFCRALVIVPAGSGFCIANELLHITNATDEQVKRTFKQPVVTSAPSSTVNSPLAVDQATREQMVQVMSQQSGMNLEWSRKCLDETQWVFERAVQVFTQLHASGTIPPEAFNK